MFMAEVVQWCCFTLFLSLQIDLLCADVDSVKLSLASPQARTNACVSSATAAVLSALHSAATIAAATARGDDAAAGRAAVAAAESAQAAAQLAEQLQLDVPTGLFGGQTSAESAVAGSFNLQPAAAATYVGPALTLSIAASHHSTAPPSSAAAAIHSAALSSAGTSLQLAAAGAQLASELAQGPTSLLLRRGAGMLVLFPNNWGGKAQLLQGGKTVIAGKPFTHCSVLQLMSEQGLLLRAGSQQSVSVRVAAEYLQPSTPLTGNWSKACFTVSITPGVNVLLHSRASHTWGCKFTAKCSAAAGYAALFPGLSQQNITTALGKQWGKAGIECFHVWYILTLCITVVQYVQECKQVLIVRVLSVDLVQFGCICWLIFQQFTEIDAQPRKGELQLAS
jgi:hypothetical protein